MGISISQYRSSIGNFVSKKNTCKEYDYIHQTDKKEKHYCICGNRVKRRCRCNITFSRREEFIWGIPQPYYEATREDYIIFDEIETSCTISNKQRKRDNTFFACLWFTYSI